ncbi:HEAT repeat domain-containing protein [Lignipirellula cremea]|uniref:HEAT repeat protein n=1 Tax=Lignipirellula cremea TaxID=2528010 RepID=A0A518DY15_9BACT|nr:HEAT repeat domain-containing protein [Lignipirellula cremea]QDU96739.1 hypothetical protein Pla8534_45600 [Lignipirellula cremea]
MSAGIEITLNLLAKTRNEAAADVLLPALDSSHRAIAEGALRSLLRRRSSAGERELVRRWNQLPERWKQIINEKPGRIAGGIRYAIVSGDAELCLNGFDALTYLGEYDLFPVLLRSAEDSGNPQADFAAAAVLLAAETLYEEIAAPRNYARRRDPRTARTDIVMAMEQSLNRFETHRRREILEAFLMLASRDNPVLKKVLGNPHDQSYLAMIDMLTHSQRQGVVQLVLSYLEEPHAPQSMLNVLSHRADPVFLGELLGCMGEETSAAARGNLKRIEGFVWLRENLGLIGSIAPHLQSGLVRLVVLSGISRLRAFEILQYVARKGSVEGRLAAFAALGEFQGAEANDLVREALGDPHPEIQAIALQQVRERGIPGAITHLIEALESPHEVVCNAARGHLSEFTFKRFLSAFDTLDAKVRRSTGRLVSKVDPEMLEQMEAELTALSRSRRIRACEAAPLLGVSAQVEDHLLEQMRDADHFVRAAAAGALGACSTPTSTMALREALLDRSSMVQEIAEKALQRLADKNRETQPTTETTAETEPFEGNLLPAADTVEIDP